LKLDQYLNELLFLHDCVIIPEFGGFVANYAPASIHPTQHIFSPPSKKIAFNKKLQNNDGLLANYIAVSEGISYADALIAIAEEVAVFNAILKDGKMILLQPTGSLFLDIEKNLQFEAGTVNYLPEAFGLVNFQSPIIKRDSVLQKIEREFQDRPALPSPDRARRFPWKVLIPVPFIALAIWGSFYTDFINNDIKSSSLSPFSAANTAPIVAKAKTSVVAQPLTYSEAIVLDTVSHLEESASPISTAVEPNKPSNSLEHYEYFIVAGCFKESGNADNMLAALKAKGFDAFIKGKNANGLTMVCYQGCESKAEASTMLSKIRTETDQNAWICSN
jgi:cell division septation protein DedD